MPEVERMGPEDFDEVRDPGQLEQLIVLEEKEAADSPSPLHDETLAAMRLRLEQLRKERQN